MKIHHSEYGMPLLQQESIHRGYRIIDDNPKCFYQRIKKYIGEDIQGYLLRLEEVLSNKGV